MRQGVRAILRKQPIKVFYSYAHRDEEHRDELETHLALLNREGLIAEWHDRRIPPGTEWEQEINDALESADLILLLVSSNFLASDYCYGKELACAMERHEKRDALVIPIIVRPVSWSMAPFSKLQALPKDAVPVTTWDNIDRAWENVADGIRRAIQQPDTESLQGFDEPPKRQSNTTSSDQLNDPRL